VTPRVGSARDADAIRARVPDLSCAYEQTRRTVLEAGLVEPRLKELCARYLAGHEVETLVGSGGLGERERAALAWARAIAGETEAADDALWERLHAHFREPELVELGYCIAFTLGQMHWLRTLGVAPDQAVPGAARR
jgi:alkylhydroperoxidase family enzyme